MQTNNIYEKIHTTLSWKRIITFNVLLFLITVIPLSVKLAQQDTENRSSAAESVVEEVVPPPSYPAEPPKIERVTEWFGKRGDTIILLGNNFGDYQWSSKLYIGDTLAPDTNIVRWSNKIIEVQIPEQARTGKVWIVVNNQKSSWNGLLLLTDIAKSAKIELTKLNKTTGLISLNRAGTAKRGMVEIAHIAEKIEIEALKGEVTSKTTSIDSFGKKTRVEFTLNEPLTSGKVQILKINYSGVGVIEIVRTEIYDQLGKIIPVYADPFGTKI